MGFQASKKHGHHGNIWPAQYYTLHCVVVAYSINIRMYVSYISTSHTHSQVGKARGQGMYKGPSCGRGKGTTLPKLGIRLDWSIDASGHLFPGMHIKLAENVKGPSCGRGKGGTLPKLGHGSPAGMSKGPSCGRGKDSTMPKLGHELHNRKCKGPSCGRG